jgi:alpha-D-ribose 1-methylphosphonate 5-phosphate C-P lyase
MSLPPPKNSSKKSLWEDMKVANTNMAHEMAANAELRDMNAKLREEIARLNRLALTLQYQLNIIRTVVSEEPK